MEAAEANGDEFGLLALDWRKAYDGIDLQTLGDTLERAKVPNWARLPLMEMYRRNRRIRVGTVICEEWEPTCGVMASCGIAVFALAICTRPWAITAGRTPRLHRRLHVDDSTAWIIGEVKQIAEALLGGIGATRDFDKAMAWRLHDGKSVVVTSNNDLSNYIE